MDFDIAKEVIREIEAISVKLKDFDDKLSQLKRHAAGVKEEIVLVKRKLGIT